MFMCTTGTEQIINEEQQNIQEFSAPRQIDRLSNFCNMKKIKTDDRVYIQADKKTKRHQIQAITRRYSFILYS